MKKIGWERAGLIPWRKIHSIILCCPASGKFISSFKHLNTVENVIFMWYVCRSHSHNFRLSWSGTGVWLMKICTYHMALHRAGARDMYDMKCSLSIQAPPVGESVLCPSGWCQAVLLLQMPCSHCRGSWQLGQQLPLLWSPFCPPCPSLFALTLGTSLFLVGGQYFLQGRNLDVFKCLSSSISTVRYYFQIHLLQNINL